MRADSRLPLSAVSLARVLADGRRVSFHDMAEATGYSLRMVPWGIERLERAGYLARTRRRGRGNKGAYTLTIPGGAQ